MACWIACRVESNRGIDKGFPSPLIPLFPYHLQTRPLLYFIFIIQLPTYTSEHNV